MSLANTQFRLQQIQIIRRGDLHQPKLATIILLLLRLIILLFQSTTSSVNQPTNQAPVADKKSDITTIQDTAVNSTLSGSDEDSTDTLEFSIVRFPSNGSLSGFEDTSSSRSATAVLILP